MKKILDNLRTELLFMTLFIAILLIQFFIDFPFAIDQEVIIFIDGIKNQLLSFEAIIIGIYIAIVSVLSTSRTPVTEIISGKGIENDVSLIISVGIWSNLLLIFFAILIPAYSNWYYALLCIVFFSTCFTFVKFFTLIISIFKANMVLIAKQIDDEKNTNTKLLSYLEKIEINAKEINDSLNRK